MDSLMSTCPGCGQTMIAGGARCDACAAGAYGGQERHEAMRLFAPAPEPMAGQLAMDAEALAGECIRRGGLPKLRAGERVRRLLPNWDSPGTVVYTVEAVNGERATVREPNVPGLAGGTLEVPLSQLVRVR